MPKSKASQRVIPIKDFSACAFCTVRRLCLPVSMEHDEIDLIESMVEHRPRFSKGDYLYHAGQDFSALFAIKSGAVKTYGVTRDGDEQITGFHFPGELLGLDAIGNEMHNCNAVALEDTVVCALPYRNLQKLTDQLPTMYREITRIMSNEIRREDEMLMVLGSMRAEQRVACFLFNLYRRLLPYSGDKSVLQLAMTRQEIGNYLGLSLETVSRRLTSLQDDDIIKVENRRIVLNDLEKLHHLCH